MAMSFDLKNLDPTELHETDLLLEDVIDALLAHQHDSNAELAVRVGAVWDRKGYPQYGSVSHVVNPGAPYRGHEENEQVLINVSLLIDRYDWKMSQSLKSTVAVAGRKDEERKAASEAAKLEAKRAQLESLRNEVAQLEEELGVQR